MTDHLRTNLRICQYLDLSSDNKRAKSLHVQRSPSHRIRIHKIRHIRRDLNRPENRSDKQGLLRLTLAHKRKEFAQ